jgi:phosphatidylserine decarboxylase
MKQSGKASKASCKINVWVWLFILISMILGRLARPYGIIYTDISMFLLLLGALFALFTVYFFRDPEARVPDGPNLVVSPGHGKVDVIDEVDEPEFMGGRCKRISMFLSVLDVHVQNAPVGGTVRLVKHRFGKFLNAMAAESAKENENVLIGFESSERPGEKIGVRLIAGMLARRIVPWVNEGDIVARGERISLIQFGSRVDVYLPQGANLKVKLGDKVRGGETIVATFD